MPYEFVIGIGSNVADSHKAVARAIDWLASTLGGISASGIYSTRPISGSGPDYANAVVAGATTFPADRLNEILKEYERANGRSPEAKLRGEVPIDLDIVFYGGECLRPAEIGRDYFRRGALEIGVAGV